ncbi:MAG: response regulator [Candidatus Omnitrophota bacterium]
MAKRILIVDDDRKCVTMLEDFLKESGYATIPAHNGEEGMEKARKLQPSLILMDVQMPRMDGDEAYMYIRGEDETKNIPIIFLTGLRSETEIAESGEENIFAKPVPLDRLLTKIRSLIGK